MLWWEALLHVHLESSKHEGTENLVQLRDELVLLVGIVNVEIEPIVELFGTRKDIGDQEVEQSPQLVQIILQGSSGQEQTVPCLEGSDGTGEGRGFVLEAMCFINNEVGPGELVEDVAVHVAHLIGRHYNVPGAVLVTLAGAQDVAGHRLSFVLGTMESHRRQLGGPALQLGHPVAQCRLGNDDEMWAHIVLEFVHVDQDRYGLECLAQTEGHEGEKAKIWLY